MTLPSLFFAALIAVESGGNDRALGDYREGRPTAYGCLQIRAGVLRDFQRLTGEVVTPEQCFDRFTALSICDAYLRHYCTRARLGRDPLMEDAARIWNGGPDGWKRDATKAYWVKVRRAMSEPQPR